MLSAVLTKAKLDKSECKIGCNFKGKRTESNTKQQLFILRRGDPRLLRRKYRNEVGTAHSLEREHKGEILDGLLTSRIYWILRWWSWK